MLKKSYRLFNDGLFQSEFIFAIAAVTFFTLLISKNVEYFSYIRFVIARIIFP